MENILSLKKSLGNKQLHREKKIKLGINEYTTYSNTIWKLRRNKFFWLKNPINARINSKRHRKTSPKIQGRNEEKLHSPETSHLEDFTSLPNNLKLWKVIILIILNNFSCIKGLNWYHNKINDNRKRKTKITLLNHKHKNVKQIIGK